MPYVGASVDESTKADWDGFLQESQYGSMSELLRGAVRKEVRREREGGTGASGDGGATGVSVEVDRLQEQQKETLDKIDSLVETVQEAQEERETEEYPEEVKEAAFAIASDLETISPDRYSDWASDANIELVKLASEHFGDGEETHKVSAALDYLEENIGWIEKKPVPPSDYYRVEE